MRTAPKRKLCFSFALNAFFALITGLIYYILRRPDTRVTQICGLIFSFQTESPLVSGGGSFFHIMDCYLADFLWAYALAFTLHAPVQFAPRLESRVFILCLFGACLTEFLQFLPSFGGVFDVFDIVVQLAAVLIAKSLIIRMKKGVNRNVPE